jgi:hypothetical protein
VLRALHAELGVMRAGTVGRIRLIHLNELFSIAKAALSQKLAAGTGTGTGDGTKVSPPTEQSW